jgi:hypothetical protein
MELLVANGTYQNYDFCYRVPEIGKFLNHLIPAGQQVVLAPGDMTDGQINAVVRQLERIGAVQASEASRLKSPRSLVYSTRKPVTENQINAAREADEKVRQEQANRQVENAGLGAFPQSPEVARKVTASTLEVRELQPVDREAPAKGGVDTSVTVSKRARQ